MICLARHGKERDLDIAHMQPLSKKLIALPDKSVLLAKSAQILHDHLSRQVRRITIPEQQIKGRRRLSHHVGLDGWPVHQIIRAQEAHRP